MPSGVQCRPKPTRCVHPHCRFAFIQIYGIDNNEDTPLHRACCWGDVEIAECLLDHDADPSIRSESFLLVSLCLLKCVLQINTVKLPFNMPTIGEACKRMWLRHFIREVPHNEVFWNYQAGPGTLSAIDCVLYVIYALWTSLFTANPKNLETHHFFETTWKRVQRV